MRYDLAYFQELNREYRSKRLVPRPQSYAPADIEERGRNRAAKAVRRFGISGRVLEIGCGRGEVCRALARDHECEAVGIDIRSYPEWEVAAPNVTLIQVDLADEPPPDLGTFDFIFSNAVFEHVRHPYTMLKRAYDYLKPGGRMWMSANLYRGPKASHRYREVYFPWPHLLFSDDVFEEFYRSLRKPPKRPAWVNQLSIADYYNYFSLIGFQRKKTDFRITPIDEDFYRRHADVLERIPRFDLERDFIEVLLEK